MMWKRRIVVAVMIIFLMGTLGYVGNNVSALQPNDPPEIRIDAPVAVQLAEDSEPFYLDPYDIFNNTGDPLNFTVWTGNDWNATFSGNIINATVKANDTVEIEPQLNMHGTENIVINATNSNGSSTIHELAVIITPVNDPPVIETIGNILVRDEDTVDLFAYQDEWYNKTVTASDIDGDRLVFIDNTSLFDINYLTGNISFKPAHKDVGILLLNITVSDINGSNCEDWVHIRLTILNVNDPPTAKIVAPDNGTIYYKDRYLFFSGKGDDPDLPFGESLSYEWRSDIDGEIGREANITIYYISVGTHIITLRVTDSGGLYAEDNITIIVKPDPYDLYFYIELETEEDTIIMEQGESYTIEMMVTNEGYTEDNITFEIVKYFGFEGDVTLSIDNIVLDSYDYDYFDVTITPSAEMDIGVYFIDICSKSGLKEANWDENDSYYYYYSHEDAESLKVIIKSSGADNDELEAAKPVWEVGYVWNFTMVMDDYFLDMEGTTSISIAEKATKTVDKEEYEVYVQEVTASMEMVDDGSDYYGYYDSYEMEMTGETYIQRSDLATVSEDYDAEITYGYGRDEETYKIKSVTTYDPPLDSYDFPIETGQSWTTDTTKTEETEYDYPDDYYDDDKDEDEYDERSTYLCLGTEEVTTPAGTFDTFVIMEYERESDYYDWYNDDYRSRGPSYYDDMDEDDYSIDYYCPDIGMTVKESTYELEYYYDDYDYDEGEYKWKETMTVELSSYSLVAVEEDGNEPDDDIPDEWENIYNITDPNEDSDHDGYTNLDEYMNGTDPTDSEDTPGDPIDQDEDGMPDAWEEYYGLDPRHPNDAALDSDNDGYSNLEEYNSGTSPDDKDDHPYGNDGDDKGSGGFNLIYLYVIILVGLIAIIAVGTIAKRRRGNVKEKGKDPARDRWDEFDKPNGYERPKDINRSDEYHRSNELTRQNEFHRSDEYDRRKELMRQNEFNRSDEYDRQNELLRQNEFNRSDEYDRRNKFKRRR